MIVQFRTDTAIPLEAFSLLGINVKVSNTAIGRFGTGLKYAVAVILRHGGTIKLFIDGVEYEFYLANKEFRDKMFKQVRMRKKNRLGKWLSSKALPFTTEFGKDWQLWQAYRELESNTRDEAGETWSFDAASDDYLEPPATGTMIEINCPGFGDTLEEHEVFLPSEDKRGRVVYSDEKVTIYDRKSKNLYYQGIRVYSLRYPARLTYDFKSGAVILTEDRTAANSWYLMHNLAQVIQQNMSDTKILYKILSKPKDDNRFEPTFEVMELNFDHTEKGSPEFSHVATSLNRSGSGGRSVSGYYGSYSSYSSMTAKKLVELPRKQWDEIAKFLKRHSDAAEDEDQYKAVEALLAKLTVVCF